MGLGKTLQAIAFLSYLKALRISPGPFLVLCPLSVTEGWVSEIANFSPSLRLLKYAGEKEHRRTLRSTIYEKVNGKSSASYGFQLPFDVLLTTYDVALTDQDFLSQFAWHYAVIDEAQRLKNPSSVLYNVLNEHFIMPRRLLLTGTPIQNNLTELWSLMHFCMPSIFKGAKEFLLTFREAGESSAGHNKSKIVNQLKTLKYVLGVFMLRRTKSKLIECGNLSLPSLTEITVIAPMMGLQKKVYLSILRKELPKLLAYSSGAANLPSLQNVVIQLRKACSHPYLFPGIEPEPYEEGEHLIQASGKLVILDKLLQKLNLSGHRVLLFAQMTHTLDILQDFLELRKYSYERLDGSIRAEERFAAIRSFSEPKGKAGGLDNDQDGAFVFMISTRAGGVGLNLVAADTVIFYEQDWNPQVDKQALQRAHRIGQMNDVLSINLVTERSVEEVVMRRAQQKLQLSNSVVGDDEIGKEGSNLADPDTSDLRSIILGLQMFDPANVEDDKIIEVKKPEFSAMVEKIILMRNRQKSDNEDGRFEISTMNKPYEESISTSDRASSGFDASLDENSYRSWVQKFKEVSSSVDTSSVEVGYRRSIPDERHLKYEASKKKAEDKKLSKWQALGYHSLCVKDPIPLTHSDTLSDLGSVNLVYGDCTLPSKVCPSSPVIIFSCVDNSGSWGRGGMFDALSRLSTIIPDAYQKASEFDDLHIGDLHFIKIDYQRNGKQEADEPPEWVALAVVQSYNAKRKVPRSSISIPDLEICLQKVSFVAAQNSASIHMPRIGYQDGSDRSVWYSVERLLRKYASMYGIKIYVYYFRR
uniref:Helicase CHR10 n=1 Tax=Kalanchoe fedtschenkoi TaxID=63787 RepID=A0A7N0UQS7_KALFE